MPPCLAAGGGSGGRGEGGSRRGSPPPSGGAACGPRLSPPSSPAYSPRVHLFSWGRWTALGPGRGLAGHWWVSLAGGGSGGQPVRRPSPGDQPRSVPPPPPPYCFPGHRRPAAVYGAPLSAGEGLPDCCGHCRSERWRAGGTRRAAELAAVVASPPGCRGPLGGFRAAAPLVGLRLSTGPGGEGGKGGGGFPGTLPGPLVPLSGGRRGAASWSRPRGASRRRGGCIRLLPPPHSSGARLSCRRLTAWCWLAGRWGGGEGQRVLGLATRVSG